MFFVTIQSLLHLGLRAGDWVEVRSPEEILASLDKNGCLDSLPFMPEMFQYCGKRFRVFRSAHKTCDTIQNWKRIRRMRGSVHLEGLRCDGTAHGGCQAGCLIFWKEAWLKPLTACPSKIRPEATREVTGCAVDRHERGIRVAVDRPNPETQYRCQATELLRATVATHWWDPRPYLQDIASGNLRLWDFLRYALIAAFNTVMRVHPRLRPYPYLRGLAGEKTPHETLNLQPGEWVQVRSKEEIMRTLNGKLRNRGLSFDVEMVPYCGGTFRVLRRVDRLIDERTGEMRVPRNPCVILEDVTCGGCLSRKRLFCPRSIYPYWHEIWLKRVDPGVECPR